ncbi:MAG: hypothetical protein Q9220_000178 [cf. Caloplaca sp. 1 TL-2023]
MSSVSEIQTLLRFLSQDAKVPVPLAMSKVREMKEAHLTTCVIPEILSKTLLPTIQSIFLDEKVSKQILSAAKRVSKKRTSSASTIANSSPSKRLKKATLGEQQLSSADFEASLAHPSLPITPSNSTLEDEINNTVIYTNRAPLVVAFVLQLLKHTMPSQPLSSRLSLAQAVMSMGAKSKAINLGIQSGKTAEDEGWGEGQPKIRIMGREVRVMRRWGYDPKEKSTIAAQQQNDVAVKQEEEEEEPAAEPDNEEESQGTIKADPSSPPAPTSTKDTEPPLWALNLETLRSTSNNSALIPTHTGSNLPIHDPRTPLNYILKAFASASAANTQAPTEAAATSSPIKKEKKSSAMKDRENKERNLALLLHALDMLFASWIGVLGAEELDRRSWGWYVRVRPDVESGVGGWGGKGEVRLARILELRR